MDKIETGLRVYDASGAPGRLAPFQCPVKPVAGCCCLLGVQYLGEKAALAGGAVSEAVFEAVADGVRTVDLRGRTATSEFTDEVIRRVRTKLAF